MRLADKVEFPWREPIKVGGMHNGYIVTRIEVFGEEYYDHTEWSAYVYSETKQIAGIIQVPMIISYTQ